MRIANMATFPGRLDSLEQTLASIHGQFDLLNLVLNEFQDVPMSLRSIESVNFVRPDQDMKDVGKFYDCGADADDYIFLLDDDIAYPRDYADRMIDYFETMPLTAKVLGVHGVTYSDFFDGRPQSRLVYPFNRRLDRFTLVNQLGTGTVLCKGADMPPLQHMMCAQRYVDVRFAAYQYTRGVDMVCVARDAEWLKQLETRDSIFDSFTKVWPSRVTRQALTIGGFAKLNALHWKCLSEWNAATLDTDALAVG